MKRDPIEILVDHQTRALVEHGVPAELARVEAERRVGEVLAEMNRIGLADVYVGVAIRRARVYQMRSSGMSALEVRGILGIRATQVFEDYRAELSRRRTHA